MTQPTIAFLGIGLMGAPMARRLLAAGLKLTVWNRSRDKAEPLAALGAVIADTPAIAAKDADIVCLCLTDAKAVEAVLFGLDGVAGVISPEAAIVDFSTIGPEPTRTLAARLPGIAWIDAPVSGGVNGATTGDLIVLCGGEQAAIAALEFLWAPLARRVTHLGPLGAGQTAKLCNQMIVAIGVMAIAEAIKVGRENGLDVARLPEALAGGFADSLPLRIFGPRMAEQISEPKLAQIATMQKDIEAALALGLPSGEGLPLTQATVDIYRAVTDRGLGSEELTALARPTT
jgi:3-hydroxyisobutyrate dehydrogenase-like beta-hydroxyacid dehydrogenase